MKKNNIIKTAITISILMIMFLLSSCASDYPLKDTPKDIAGNEESPLRVIEYSDLQCPACKAAHPTLKRIKDEYGSVVGFEFRHYPLSIHEYAPLAAEASECANDQGKFWEFVDDTYANQDKLAKRDLIERAQNLGLDVESFKSCLSSGSKKATVNADARGGREKRITGTPTFFIDGRNIDSWDYTGFKKELDAALLRHNLSISDAINSSN